MRFQYVLALILTLTIAATYWYQSTEYLCPIPITYRLGEIDGSFGLTQRQVLTAVEQAADVWQAGVPADLFQYSEDGTITISLVFDERQAALDQQSAAGNQLDEAAASNAQLRDKVAALQARFERDERAFTAAKTAYETRLRAYNDIVRQINDRGGATQTEAEEVEQTKVELASELATLEQQRASLASVAAELDQLITRANKLLAAYQQQVESFNDQFAGDGSITQSGHYSSSGEIEVYRFGSQEELVAILAHEFGHALGMGHVAEPGSLMSTILHATTAEPYVLSETDRAVFADVCQFDSWQFKVRQMIRKSFDIL